jgi:hypothetical protein
MLTAAEQTEIMRLARLVATAKLRGRTEQARAMSTPRLARERLELAEQRLAEYLKEAG